MAVLSMSPAAGKQVTDEEVEDMLESDDVTFTQDVSSSVFFLPSTSSSTVVLQTALPQCNRGRHTCSIHIHGWSRMLSTKFLFSFLFGRS